MNDEMDDEVTLPFPIEFIIHATPRSHQSTNRKAREEWKERINREAKEHVATLREFTFLDERPLSATIFYFAPAPMEGDVDNIVKLILDGMLLVIYPDDRLIEKVTVQKFDPSIPVVFQAITEKLEEATDADPPVIYIRIDDDLNWRQVP